MILVIQFREDVTEQHEQQCICTRLHDETEITFKSMFDKSVNFAEPQELLQGVTKLILGGSAGLSAGPGHKDVDYEKVDYVFKNIEPLIKHVFKEDFPTFGTCFGHQLIGKFLGSEIVYDHDMAETGFAEIKLTEEGRADRIFHGAPDQFYAVVGHQDSLDGVPKEAVHLAYSDNCPTQAFRYRSNIYCTQFHGELDTEDLRFRLNLFPAYRKHARDLEDRDTSSAVKVLHNFLD